MLRNQTYMNHNRDVAGVATGLFIGSLIGAGTMLLFAPQSGKRTRHQIQLKGLELRDQATELAEDTVSQVLLESKKLSKNASHKAKEIVQQGQGLVSEQFAQVSEFVENGKKSILGS